jgi:fatty aldehyde decarbonylase
MNMSTAVMRERIAEVVPAFRGQIAGVDYLLAILRHLSKQHQFTSSSGGRMEPLIRRDCSAIDCISPSPSAPIWQDILAQAMTGELLAAMNYTSLSEICDDPEKVADALEHAEGERGHAAAFAAEGHKIGVDVSNNVDAKHWKRLRTAFMRCITERDFIGCLIVQEIMLESFAVASYGRVGRVAPGSLGRTFASIARAEEGHIDHAIATLRAERALDVQRFDDKLYRLHLDVMTTLAEMLAKDCKDGHCEVCHGSCVKPSLSEVGLSAAALRGASLQQYLKTLDKLGIPGEVTLAWVTQLPV